GARGVSRRRFTAGFQSCGEVTAVSRNSGTRRTREDTGGLERTRRARRLSQEDTQGTAGIRKDTPLCRFGTVRPRVQIPGPRPDFEFRCVRWDLTQDAPRRRRVTAVSQIWKNSVAAARLRWFVTLV